MIEAKMDVVSYLMGVNTPTVSNAVERLGVRNAISGYTDRTLKHLTPELGVMCGYAVTAEMESVSPDAETALDEQFIKLCESIAESPKPCVVVARETTGRANFGMHCGDLMATAFHRLGAVGLVSDSAVRDLIQVERLGFHFFAPGLVASHGSLRVVRVQVPVTVCGLPVEAGDLLHGDVNGLISVPQEGRAQLPSLCEEVRTDEQVLLDYLHSKDFDLTGLQKLLLGIK